ncbi:hypothetical protein BDV98DRAFT_597051 [Pterulicium gracile]|uniref:Uncharacterized protein n=1 Tax=Pterulicium gracile TaxID=1884261 RepID=A0A5C3Q608_9AGAR|nr:hypothetical protein BDV98DRAFT_597051 [Pterula gracilis]
MSSSVQVLVDDSDAKVSYTDGWVELGDNLEYKSTTHGTRTNNIASLSFRFSGTKIGVYATVPLPGNGIEAPKVSCSVDGASIPSFTPKSTIPGEILYNYLQCESSALSTDTEHVLGVDVNTTVDKSWYLDYMIYETPVQGQNVLSGPDIGNSSIQIIVDEADSRVRFDPPDAWNLAGVIPEHESTTHFTTRGGATSTFSFSGTGIEVYGTLGLEESQNPFNVSFSIDGKSAGTYQSIDVERILRRMPFFSSGVLPDSEHTLVATYMTDGARTMFLDYFVYDVTPSRLLSGPSSLSIPSPTSSTTPSAPQSSSIAADPSPKQPERSPNDHIPNQAAIVGGVVAGVIALLLLTLGLLFWFRRRARAQHPGSPLNILSTGEPAYASPFLFKQVDGAGVLKLQASDNGYTSVHSSQIQHEPSYAQTEPTGSSSAPTGGGSSSISHWQYRRERRAPVLHLASGRDGPQSDSCSDLPSKFQPGSSLTFVA